MNPSILQVMADRELLLPYFNHSLSSWKPWATALRCLYGLPIKSQQARELVQRCTGRAAEILPSQGFDVALLLTGRRSGKSRIAAAVAAYEGLFGGHDKRLAPGEVGTIPVISPTREQSTIVWRALHSIFSTPLLAQEVAVEKEGEKLIILRNGIQIKILVGDWRTVRGFTIVCAVVDEICFMSLAEEMKIRNDSELIRALRPGLATTKGKMVCISSPYSKKGWAYQTWLKQHGCNKGVSPSFVEAWSVLVWQAPSRTMHPTLPQSVVDAAMAEDPASARSEYFGEWRDDISGFIDLETVERCVVKGRKELLPHPGINYFAFTDLSGGRGDNAALAIGHQEERKLIVDCLRSYKPPFSPYDVIRQQANELKRYGIKKVTGDNYSAEFVASAFRAEGIAYTKSDKPASALYLELLPRLCSAEIELLDNERLISQIASLERRTRSGGNDVVSHPPNQHDDEANVIAGLSGGTRQVVRIGAFPMEEFIRSSRPRVLVG